MNGKLKRAVDVLMTAALLILMGYQFWGEKARCSLCLLQSPRSVDDESVTFF